MSAFWAPVAVNGEFYRYLASAERQYPPRVRTMRWPCPRPQRLRRTFKSFVRIGWLYSLTKCRLRTCSTSPKRGIWSVPCRPDPTAQSLLLQEVDIVFTDTDNIMLTSIPDKKEIKATLDNSNLHAAPGTDGLTSFLYKECWGILGDSITEMVQAVCGGSQPTKSQRTSLMVFGCKPKKTSI